MAGYAGYSMSNNAIDAYNDEKMPISILKKWLGIKDVSYGACEWHHTSKEYNTTDFFDAREAIKCGDIIKYSNAKPNALQLYHRYYIKCLIAEESGFDKTAKMSAKLAILGRNADIYIQNRDDKRKVLRAKKLAEKEAQKQLQIKEQMEKWKNECTAKAIPQIAFRLKCQAITKEKLREILLSTPTDNTGIVFQVHKWFANTNLSLEEKINLAL